jgi:hypothetical protein
VNVVPVVTDECKYVSPVSVAVRDPVTDPSFATASVNVPA